MLRYIYLFCFLYFELVFCYNCIHGKERPRQRRRQEMGRLHRSSSSPLAHIDMINFMQKPESLAFEPHNYENRRRSSADYLLFNAPAPRRRRARHQLAAPADGPHAHGARPHHRLHPHHFVHHPKRKCSFGLFPFFSHKNKNKTKPAPSPKHERNSHSVTFSKSKENYKPVVTDKREQKKMKQDVPVAEPKIETPMKSIAQNCKMKNAQQIHNSRLYFANPYRINNDGDFMGLDIDKGNK